MAHAASRKKKCHLSRESRKSSKKPAPSLSSSDLESDSSSDKDQPKQIIGGAARGIRGKHKKLKSGITEKLREADITQT